MSTPGDALVADRLYRGRKGRLELVDVPELGYLVLNGRGAPHDQFPQAFATLMPLAYGAHFALWKRGVETRIMPPEAVFWVDGPEPWALGNRPQVEWQWSLMVMQPAPIDEQAINGAMENARRRNVPGLDDVRFERWHEGLAAQTLHVGPYDEEWPAINALHAWIADEGLRPHQKHHEIYLGDPRRSAPERLRTLIRQPVVQAG